MYPMNLKPQGKSILISIIAVIFFLSCQEKEISPIIEEVNTAYDQDMIDALEMADAYLNSTNLRVKWSSRSVTVLKFENNKLQYHTNNIDGGGYTEVEEESITAMVKPGDLVFWYSGGGVVDLEGIEFSPDSEVQLEELPMETNRDKMWMVTLKTQDEDDEEEDDEEEDDEEEDDAIYLKYDIIYKAKGADEYIRLDPRIKVSQ